MAQFAAFIFVTPEYNYGIPASTKNAVDYLYHEMITKPAMVVSYGTQGGKIASESLKTTLEGMKLRVVKTRPALPFHGGPGPDMFDAVGKGELGEDTRKDWEEDKKKDVLEGVAELEELMNEEVIPKKQVE
jgi:NAD(P)H-dependent FMN reductase